MKRDNDFQVTLLGTGTPIPSKDRFGPCTLIEAGDQKAAHRCRTLQSWRSTLAIKAGNCD
jgi:ribonuclease BN (tRNA processing enzyme)